MLGKLVYIHNIVIGMCVWKNLKNLITQYIYILSGVYYPTAYIF